MFSKNVFIATILSLAFTLGAAIPTRVLAAGDAHDEAEHDHGKEETNHEGHAEHAEEEFKRGTHNGRLLVEGDFSVEVTIFEDGVPPQFRFYVSSAGKPVDASQLALKAELHRLGGKVDTFTFTPEKDYFIGSGTVKEPHSFDVKVAATYQGKSYNWHYDSYEGRTEITAAAAKTAGMETLPAGAAIIRETVLLNGSIELDPNKTATIKARFAGIVRDVKKNIGDTVSAGDVLATVESNDSLQVYAVKSPINGVVLARNTNIGDVAGDAPLFTVANLSTMLAELHVFQKDISAIKLGNPVMLASTAGKISAKATIDAFMPLVEASSQTVIARVRLDNTGGQWRPGMLVTGTVVTTERTVPLAVKNTALQRFRESDVVFAKVGNTYEVRMLELGASDGEWTEVKSGLDNGEMYVSNNSFLIRADIEKSGASHDH